VQKPIKSGPELIEEIDRTLSVTPTLWWLGHAGFVVRFATITFYIDPCLSDLAGRTRRMAAPLAAADIRHADMIFATHAHPGHLDAPSVPFSKSAEARNWCCRKARPIPRTRPGFPTPA